MAIKLIIGLVIIVASFGYILKNHDKSMIENMQDKQQKRFEARKAAEAAAAAQAAETGTQAEAERTACNAELK